MPVTSLVPNAVGAFPESEGKAKEDDDVNTCGAAESVPTLSVSGGRLEVKES